MKPLYIHDCDNCQFLGSVLIDGQGVDLYHCGNEPTILARYSDEGSDNASGMCFGRSGLARLLAGDVLASKGLTIAYVLSVLNGLNTEDRFSSGKGKTVLESANEMRDYYNKYKTFP